MGIVLGIVWVLFLGSFLGLVVYHNLTLSKIFFVISVGMIMLITSIATVGILPHRALISRINYSESISNTQQNLQSSTST